MAIISLFMDRWTYGRADGRFLRMNIYVASHQHNNYMWLNSHLRGNVCHLSVNFTK